MEFNAIKKCFIILTIALIIFIFLEISKGSSTQTGTVFLLFPRNNSIVGGTNDTIPFIFSHNGFLRGVVNCTLYINNIPVAYVENVSANFSVRIHSNSSLTAGINRWNVSCFNSTMFDNSTTFVFTLLSCDIGNWSSACQINTTKSINASFINTTNDLIILGNGRLTTGAGNGTTAEIWVRNLVIFGAIEGNVNIT
ncbi:MAG: hypothetical protein RMJ17_02645, partial [Candidatus Aenigmarchaeota archaeon]|nr:hypothetical protein [Candidatus Aenigmarchaeota archaeon]MDW8149468.1 hypothetical protein [Candidatus Aenigmarchaeota archaeon]